MATTEFFVSSVILYFSKRLIEISMIYLRIAYKTLSTSQSPYCLRDKGSWFSKLKKRIMIIRTTSTYQYLTLKFKIKIIILLKKIYN